jgi:hypothetical protein
MGLSYKLHDCSAWPPSFWYRRKSGRLRLRGVTAELTLGIFRLLPTDGCIKNQSEGFIMLHLDHVTVTANSLAAGVSHTERALDVRIPTGGSHQVMGTHNHLLRLGEMLFLEVIASDPVAGPLLRPRWFALDDPRIRTQLETSPRLCTWVVRTEDIAAALRSTPKEAGEIVKVGRGKLEWLISVPPDGSMPFDGAFPTILQ